MNVITALGRHTRVKDDVGERVQQLFQDFLEEYKEDGEVKYLRLAKEIHDEEERCMMEVSFEDVEKYNQNLAMTIIEEFYRVYPFICQAVGNYVKNHFNLKMAKECYVSFMDVATRHKLRELRSEKIGTLVRISAQVVRTHPVHPELVLATFVCADCQTVIKNVEQQLKFTNPTICVNPLCNNRNNFILDMDNSVFVDFQKIRIQELQSEMPRGSIPRNIELILRAENVEVVKAGDRYDFTGTLIVVPNVMPSSFPGAKAQTEAARKVSLEDDGVKGFKMLGVRSMNYRLAFIACGAQPTLPRFGGVEMPLDDMSPETLKKHMTEDEWQRMYNMSHDRNLYQNLINSLFSGIHGYEEVKKGVLLMLFGGVGKKTMEGTTLRGDINCCIVGDPSTAKSQLLKQVAEFAPRAVYTSGKATTAAGLTAAILRDADTGDFVIEAGALMLADNGVCCIDEFDKMDYTDQVAIHEAMEQQTISLSKANIRATLNARTSILAAANPIKGRYDKTRSLQQNIALTAPIMSRFDLFFVLVDDHDEVLDYAIARKIVDMHCNVVDSTQSVYSKKDIWQYIALARQFKPVISKAAGNLLVHYYKDLRIRGSTTTKSTWRITVRQLESMVRLSEAMARMELTDEVQVKHVREAYRLLTKSIIRVEMPEIHLDEDGTDIIPDIDRPLEEQEEMIKQKLTLTFEEYKNLCNMVVVHIRHEEQKQDDGAGLLRSKLIEWYLNLVGDEIETEDDLLIKSTMIEKVLDRLTYHDHVLIPISTTGGRLQADEDCLLGVHPNYVLDQ